MAGALPLLLGLGGAGLGELGGAALGNTGILGGVTGLLNEGLGTALTTQGVGSTIGRTVGGGVGTALGSRARGDKFPGRSGLVGAGATLAAPYIKPAWEAAKDKLKGLLGPSEDLHLSDIEEPELTFPSVPSMTSTSAGRAAADLPPMDQSPARRREMLERLLEEFR